MKEVTLAYDQIVHIDLLEQQEHSRSVDRRSIAAKALDATYPAHSQFVRFSPK